MALYDDKRFILSHIHHSFITCDDTGSSEAVMLTENALERYPPTALYHTPFDYDSDEEFYYGVDRRYEDEEEDEGDESEEGDNDVMAEGGGGDKEGDEKTTAANDKVDAKALPKTAAAAANLISQDDLDFFKVTELDYKSDLLDDHYANTTGINNTQNNSFDIMSESFEVGMRRRSNTAQRLEKLKKERKYQSKTRVVTWKSPTKVVSVVDQALGKTVEKRLVVHPTALPPEEIAMLEFDEKEGVYYETEEYRKFLFPYNPEGDPTGETDSGEEIEDEEFLVVEEEEVEEEDQSEQKVDKKEVKQEKTESQDSDDPVGELPQLKSPTRSSEGTKRRSSAFAGTTNHRRQSKSVASVQSSQNRRKSVLTLAIESSPAAPLNPFNKFTRFNGLVSEGEATKRIRIFFKIFEGSQFGDKLLDKFDKDDKQKTIVKLDFTKRLGRNFASSGIAFGVDWIEVVVLASARVSDLIGLICWNYTHLQLGPPLKEDPTAYALKIAEENGDVDNDFPALTAGDDIKRYGFPYLALVELETHIVVTVHFEPDQVFSQITLSSLTVTLEEIVEQVRKKRPHLFRALDGGSSSHHHQRPLSPTAEEGGGSGTSKQKSPTSPTSITSTSLDGSRIRLTLSTEPGKPLELSSKIAEYVETPTGSRASSHQAVAFSLKILSREEAFKAAGAKNSRQQLLDVTDALPSTGKDGEEISTGSFKGSLFKSGLHHSSAATLRANRSSIALYSLDTSSSTTAANEATTSSSYTNTSTILGRGKGLRSRDWSQNMLDQMEAPLYQAFELNAVHKLYNTPVEMGISGTKVEITPRSGGGGSYGRSPSSSGGNGGGGSGGHSTWTSNFADRLRARFNQMKAINMDVEDVVDCEVIPRAKMEVLGRHYFKLVYYNGSGEFKSLKFEGDALTVDDILFKLANVMKMRTSPRRVEYQAYKNRKKSLSTKIYLRSRMMLSSSSSSSSDDLTDDGGGNGGGGNGGGGGNSTTGGAGMSTGAESVLSDPSGPEGSWIGTHLGRQKREAKFRRFRSRP